MIGNLMADLVKGNAIDELPPAIREGVLLHRAVDTFTDAHPLHVLSRSRLGPRWSRVSGIVIDVYYDHILARDWVRYREIPLRQFLDSAYEQFLPHCHGLAEKYQIAAQGLVREDLMMSYAEEAGIERALTRISRRLRGGAFSLEEAVSDLRRLDSELTGDFHGFFPELLDHAEHWTNR